MKPLGEEGSKLASFSVLLKSRGSTEMKNDDVYLEGTVLTASRLLFISAECERCEQH